MTAGESSEHQTTFEALHESRMTAGAIAVERMYELCILPAWQEQAIIVPAFVISTGSPDYLGMDVRARFIDKGGQLLGNTALGASNNLHAASLTIVHDSFNRLRDIDNTHQALLVTRGFFLRNPNIADQLTKRELAHLRF